MNTSFPGAEVRIVTEGSSFFFFAFSDGIILRQRRVSEMKGGRRPSSSSSPQSYLDLVTEYRECLDIIRNEIGVVMVVDRRRAAWLRIVDIVPLLSPYDLFQLPRGSDVATVKRAYREMIIFFHPDHHMRREAFATLEEANKIVVVLNSAKTVLCDGTYDASKEDWGPKGNAGASEWRYDRDSGQVLSAVKLSFLHRRADRVSVILEDFPQNAVWIYITVVHLRVSASGDMFYSSRAWPVTPQNFLHRIFFELVEPPASRSNHLIRVSVQAVGSDGTPGPETRFHRRWPKRDWVKIEGEEEYRANMARIIRMQHLVTRKSLANLANLDKMLSDYETLRDHFGDNYVLWLASRSSFSDPATNRLVESIVEEFRRKPVRGANERLFFSPINRLNLLLPHNLLTSQQLRDISIFFETLFPAVVVAFLFALMVRILRWESVESFEHYVSSKLETRNVIGPKPEVYVTEDKAEDIPKPMPGREPPAPTKKNRPGKGPKKGRR